MFMAVDIPGPVAYLRARGEALGKVASRWGHLRYEELGADLFHDSGLPEALIQTTTDLYGTGRTIAKELEADFACITDPLVFPDISRFIEYFDRHVSPRIVELEEDVARCSAELAAVPADFDWHPVFEQMQAHAGAHARSPWHLLSTIKAMIGLANQQLTMMRSAQNDVVALRVQPPAPAAVAQEPPPAPRLKNAFYQNGDFWVVSYSGSAARTVKDHLGLHDYAYLLAHPYESVAVMDLIRMTAGHDADARRRHEFAGNSRGIKGDWLLNSETIRNLKAKLLEIKEELARAEEDNNLERAESLRRDREECEQFLVKNVRARFPDDRGKARLAVAQRMKTALGAIRGQIPELADYL